MAERSFRPPANVAAAARRGLDYRRRAGGRGGLNRQQASQQGIGSGVQRAANLSNRNSISLATIRRMKAFFDRHERNARINPEFRNEPWRDRGYVAWLLWGGNAGRAWANRILRQVERQEQAARLMAQLHEDAKAKKLKLDL